MRDERAKNLGNDPVKANTFCGTLDEDDKFRERNTAMMDELRKMTDLLSRIERHVSTRRAIVRGDSAQLEEDFNFQHPARRD